jgi:hypothetical protein
VYKAIATVIFVLVATFSVQAQAYYTIKGYVVDEDANPLSGVVIRVFSENVGAVTNDKGQYSLTVAEGLNRLYFSYIGYETKKVEEVILNDRVLNVTLAESDEELTGVVVKNRRRDLSFEIIRKTSEQRDRYLPKYQTQRREIYVKSVEEITNLKSAKPEKEEDKDPFHNDSIANLNLFEATFIQHKKLPHKIKEEKTAAKKLGSQRDLFYTTTTQAEFNFLDNLIFVKKLGDNSYVSPIASTAILAYRYKLLGSRFENGQKVYTIKVIPRKAGNALFKGEIEVWDELFAIKSVNLSVNKNSLIVYDGFDIHQEYGFIDSNYVVLEEKFQWKVKLPGTITEGTCIAKYSNYSWDSTYSKRFFGAEVGVTKQDAYEKDTSFWAQIRPVPLTTKEQEFIQYQDSIERLKNSKEYLDSIDAEYNKITALELLLNGFGFIDRENKVNWEFDPAISLIDPVAIGGWRVRYSGSYLKRFESRKRIFVSPFLNYGFRNQDLKGNLTVDFLYDPKKISSIRLNTGRYFGFVNQFATITDIARRSNFFEQEHLYLYHRTELFNGFYLRTGVQMINRSDLGDFQFSAIGDTLFGDNNVALSFDPSFATEGVISIEYTPKQLYLQEPKEKIVLGSKFPTFTLLYKQAVPNLLGSNTNYKFAEISAQQTFNIGIAGQSEYKIAFGGFLDTTSLQIMDYRYMRGGDPFVFLPPMFGYQLIDSTFPVFNPFFESHYVHQFNGFLTSKIPGLKHLNIKTMAGGGFLYVPERKYQYAEVFGGLNRIFKIGKERFRLGLYYVAARSNTQGFNTGFKISFEPYNAQTNTWSF